MPLRDCDYDAMADGAIHAIYQRTPEEYDIGTNSGSFSVEYKIIVAGPNPENYRAEIWDLIGDYVPMPLTNEVPLPPIGSFVFLRGRYFVVEKIALKVRKESDFNDCRHWRATVNWVQATKDKQPQNQAGQPLDRNNIDQAQATVKIRSAVETENVEFAYFESFRDATGADITCDAPVNDKVCQPLHGAHGKWIPVINSAGVRFEPGLTRDAGLDTILISKPMSAIPYGIQRKLRNCVNCDRFFIVEFRDGVPFVGIDVDPYSARVSAISHTVEKMADGSEYPVLHLELVLKRQVLEYLNDLDELVESDNFGHFDLVANRGFSMLRYPGEDDYNGGQWNDDPLPTGGAATVPITVDGQQVIEAQWLDCQGRPVVPADINTLAGCVNGIDPTKIVYLSYLKYKKIKFASANFPGFLGNVFFNTNTSGSGSLPSAHFPGWAASGDLSGTVLQSIADFETCD